ncbi:MAG: hypothetical protein J6M14_04880 [Campylobacter sp.]|nr:hypothetical protein [Campylobacter sp.]
MRKIFLFALCACLSCNAAGLEKSEIMDIIEYCQSDISPNNETYCSGFEEILQNTIKNNINDKIAKDEQEATAQCKELKGDVYACNYMVLINAKNNDLDNSQMQDALGQICNLTKNPESCTVNKGNTEQDKIKMQTAYKNACQNGDMYACGFVDEISLQQKSCDANFALGCFNLANTYDQNNDKENALKYYAKACKSANMKLSIMDYWIQPKTISCISVFVKDYSLKTKNKADISRVTTDIMTLVSDVSAYYTATCKLSKFEEMSYVKISPTKVSDKDMSATYTINEKECVEIYIENKDGLPFGIRKGKDSGDEVCKKLYQEKSIQKLMAEPQNLQKEYCAN